MIPYSHQQIFQDDIKEVVKVLKSDWLTQGPKVLEFEKKLAKYCNAKYAVAVSHGTAALHLAYLIAGLKKGDEVITTPNTFVATTNMLLAVGAKPVFCDIRADTYNIDESKIEKLITKKTKAIVPVHFAGQPCVMAEIHRIAKRYKLLVIEDACHALGAKYRGKKIGGLSDLTALSFHPVKSITTGEGGAIVTNNKEYYKKLILLRSHGIYKNEQGKNIMLDLGYNYRLTDIQAALGISQLKKINQFIAKRNQLKRFYDRQLKNIEGVILPVILANNYSSCHLYILRVKDKRNQMPLYNYLLKNKIGANFHYPCIHKQIYYQQNGYKGLSCLNAEMYEKTAITIPFYPSLSRKEINYIIDKIRLFFYEKY